MVTFETKGKPIIKIYYVIKKNVLHWDTILSKKVDKNSMQCILLFT